MAKVKSKKSKTSYEVDDIRLLFEAWLWEHRPAWYLMTLEQEENALEDFFVWRRENAVDYEKLKCRVIGVNAA